MQDMPPRRLVNPRLLWLFASLGCVAQVCQVILLRELLALAEGTELTIAIVLGLWLVFTALGSLTISKAVKENWLSVAPKIYGSLSALLIAFVFFDLFLIRYARVIFALPPGEPLSVVHWLVVAVAVLLPVCFVVGAQFVLAASVASPSGIYIAESVGAVIAGALLSLLLLRLFDHASILASFTAFHALSSLFLTRIFYPAAGWNSALLLAVSGLTLITAPLFEGKTQKLFWQSMLPNAKLYRSSASPYGVVTAVKYEDQLSVYQNGHLLFTLPDRGDISPLVHLILLQHPNPKRILLVGGAGGWVQAALKHSKIASVDWVDLDPTIPNLLMQLLPLKEKRAFSDPRLMCFFADGRSFIRQVRQPYDIVIVVASDPKTASINRFFTQEFFAEVIESLNPGGIFALHGLYEPPSGFGELYLSRNHCVYNTLLSVFRKVLVVPSSPLTLLACCPKGRFSLEKSFNLSLSEFTLLQRARARGLDNINLFAFTDPVQVERVNYELKTGLPFNPLKQGEGEVPIRKWLNSDSNPTVYFLSSLLWLRMSNERLAKALEPLLNLPRWSISLLAFLPLAFWLLGRRKLANLVVPTITISIVGSAGMLMELTILLGFQARLGTLYQQVGLLFALFMFGLAAGAWLVGGKQFVKPIFTLSLLSLITSAAALAWLGTAMCLAKMPTFVAAVLCGFFMVLTGSLVGAAFPLTVSALTRYGVGVREAAGIAYAYDLFGGAVGAFLLGAILLPLWGTSNLISLCAVACLVTSLVCWIQNKTG
ncbi:MAG: hypothetical protein ACUVRR_07830 [Candidatus Fervidibacter sp.]